LRFTNDDLDVINRRREGGSQIQITDDAALEEISCECFAASKRNFDKVHPK
jgi:hypothetical protein